MKKYGKKWRKLHKNDVRATNVNFVETAASKIARETQIEKAEIKILLEKANVILDKYIDNERLIRKEHEIEIENQKGKIPMLIESPVVIAVRSIKPKTLNEKLLCNCIEMMGELNSLFDVAKKEKSVENIYVHLVLGKYDIEKQGILPFGKRYIDALCVVVEGTTWYSRKNTDQILVKIFDEFEKRPIE